MKGYRKTVDHSRRTRSYKGLEIDLGSKCLDHILIEDLAEVLH